jgi:hypothetical protein
LLDPLTRKLSQRLPKPVRGTRELCGGVPTRVCLDGLQALRHAQRFHPFPKPMALRDCPECEKPVSTKAPACPHCGYVPPTTTTGSLTEEVANFLKTEYPSFYLFVQVICAVALVLGGVGIYSDFKKDAARPPARAALSAEISWSLLALNITNQEDEPWRDCRITVNRSITNPLGYAATLRAIPAGEAVSVPFARLLSYGGERFNLVTTALQDVTLACDTPTGNASYEGTNTP